jgi:hypothetical protein
LISVLWLVAMLVLSRALRPATVVARGHMAAVLGLSVATLFTAAAAPARAAAPREWNFAVSLDGRPIGEHRFTLSERGDLRELESEARFNVKFLFINAYRYEHRARERWQGDCLQSLDARTDANGKPLVVAGQRDPGGFRLRAGDTDTLPDACVQTFAYWNPSILDARRLLNPQTGEYVDVKVLLMGREVIDGQPADRYRLIGSGGTPLQIDLWYTPAFDWVALESLTPEGRRLQYARK